MKHVTPKVFHLASTGIDRVGLREFLSFHGVPDWETDAENAGEELIEICGRRCYKSFETDTVKVSEQNPNLSKVREGNDAYIGNILKVGHGSVLEHASTTFAFENVSRVFTHEVVRHRLCAFSQESLRFVRPTSLDAYFPEVFKNLPEQKLPGGLTLQETVDQIFSSTFEQLEEVQAALIDLLGMDEVSRAFGDKKKLQSAMRRLMPIGLSTGIIVTTNHRNWRHLIALRTSKAAEEEIRNVFFQVAEQMAELYPAIYQDMAMVDGEVHFDYGRV